MMAIVLINSDPDGLGVSRKLMMFSGLYWYARQSVLVQTAWGLRQPSEATCLADKVDPNHTLLTSRLHTPETPAFPPVHEETPMRRENPYGKI